MSRSFAPGLATSIKSLSVFVKDVCKEFISITRRHCLLNVYEQVQEQGKGYFVCHYLLLTTLLPGVNEAFQIMHFLCLQLNNEAYHVYNRASVAIPPLLVLSTKPILLGHHGMMIFASFLAKSPHTPVLPILSKLVGPFFSNT